MLCTAFFFGSASPFKAAGAQPTIGQSDHGPEASARIISSQIPGVFVHLGIFLAGLLSRAMQGWGFGGLMAIQRWTLVSTRSEKRSGENL